MVQQAFKARLTETLNHRKAVRDPEFSISTAPGRDRIPLLESTTRITDNNPWLRRVTRVARHLRDDLARLHPRDTMPSTWMIKCLISSLPESELGEISVNELSICDEQWDKRLSFIMQNIFRRANKEGSEKFFFETDGVTPLFPNREQFNIQHARNFAGLAIRYLKNYTCTEANIA